jgi:hypothetical protein
MARLFSKGGSQDRAQAGFEVIPTSGVEPSVTESSRHGAPMVLIRGGEERAEGTILIGATPGALGGLAFWAVGLDGRSSGGR